MAMFDWYEVREGELTRCPKCGNLLKEWQGKEGPNGLFLWMQGKRHPIDQIVDEESKISEDKRRLLILPDSFTIYSYDCPMHSPVVLRCQSDNGIWINAKFKL